MSYRIQKLEQQDIKATAALGTRCFGNEWKDMAHTDFSACFSDYPYKPLAFTAKTDDKIIGAALIAPNLIMPDCFSITWLCTHPDFRKQGIAESLVKTCEHAALKELCTLGTAMFLLASAIDHGYYAKMGYETLTNTPRGFPLMVKKLDRNEVTAALKMGVRDV